MKKTLNDIFDQATASDIDNLAKQNAAPEVSADIILSVKNKVYEKTNPDKKKKRTQKLWLRFGAIAACFLLIVSAVIVVPMLREDNPGVEPYIPNGTPWSPIIDSDIEEIEMSAEEVGKLFMYTNGTNQYTEIYSPSLKYLRINPLPNAEYLPIYSKSTVNPSKRELNDFIAEYFDSATAFFGISTKSYEIKEDEAWNGNTFYEAEVSGNKKLLCFTAINNSLNFHYYSFDEKRLEINGGKVSILKSDTDEQIKEKLDDTIKYVCTSFGKEYSDIMIYRYYSYEQSAEFTIYLYSQKETNFPEVSLTSDYIVLTFHTNLGSGSIYDWEGSKEEAFLTDIYLFKTSQKWNDYYTIYAKAKMLTLEEAEQLLEKGYVFGGHYCSWCMAEQPEVDFSNYTCVNIEYVYDIHRNIYFPFYAFYKYIGKNQYGMDTYAKTYVSAVQLSGYEEYFESQKNTHVNN